MAGECILIIDDSREIIKHLSEHVLPSFEYKTLHAYDGRTGLELIRAENPDLVMLDYNLPEMTGLDVLQEMAKESLTTPVVLMTGYGSELSAIEAFRLGAKDYLIKPFTVDEILDTIDRALTETRLLHDKQDLAEKLRRVKVEMSRQTHEMNTLFSIGKAITSLLSVDKVLERVLEVAAYLARAEESTIWLPDDEGLHLFAYERQTTENVAEVVGKLPIAGTQLGQVMRTGRPLRQSVFSGQGIKIQTGLFARAVLYVPLKLRGVTVGVLSVSNQQSMRSFSKRDEFLLSFLADYAAIALENARVFQAADQALAARLDELNTLIEVTRTITSSLNLEEVVRTTIKQVHDSWNIEASSVWLVDESRQSLFVLTNVGTPDDILTTMRVPMGEGFVGTVAKTGKWIYTNDVATHPLHYREIDSRTGFQTRSLLCVPLLLRGEVMGAMQLLNKRDDLFDDQDVEWALSIAAAVAIAVTNAMLFKESETRKQHLEATLEHNNSPIFITDSAQRVLLLNQQARRRFNLTRAAIGQPIDQVLPPKLLAALFGDGTAVSPDGAVVLEDGSVWLPRLAPIPGHGRILIMQDITSLRQLDEAKDHFVATVSHDLRAPLNNIAGFAQNIRDAGDLNEIQEMSVQRILRSADHMMALVNGLLELASVNTESRSDYQPCQLIDIVQDVLLDFQTQARQQQLTIHEELPPETAVILGNPHQLRRAISNLIDNAIKYSSPGAAITVTVVTSDTDVALTVMDEGDGIDPADLPQIFDKFYRGKSAIDIEGTGLGLALVQSIVEAHNGHVLAESNGLGSTFTARFPKIDPKS